MYLYPDDIREICDLVRTPFRTREAGPRLLRVLQAMEATADEAERRYGDKATVSVDTSAARGYALPKHRAA